MSKLQEFFITNNLTEWAFIPRDVVAGHDGLAVLLPYRVHKLPSSGPTVDTRYLRIGSFAAWNHYRVLANKLKALAALLRTEYGFAKHEIRVAVNSRAAERPLALAAGLGWMGKSGLLVNPRYGSACVIGIVLAPRTDALYAENSDAGQGASGAVTLPGDSTGRIGVAAKSQTRIASSNACEAGAAHVLPGCSSCTACVEACPTSALSGVLNGGFAKERCLQYWMSKGDMPVELAMHRGSRLYGCDECVKVCPYTMQGQNVPDLAMLEARYSLEERRPGPLVPTAELAGKRAETVRAYFRGTALGLSWLPFEAFSRFASKQCGKGCMP